MALLLFGTPETAVGQEKIIIIEMKHAKNKKILRPTYKIVPGVIQLPFYRLLQQNGFVLLSVMAHHASRDLGR